MIYQRCEENTNTSCTCGVAVQSGDDVFVIDRCRRTGQTGASVLKRTVLFTNGQLTQGTRIFRQKEGAQFLVSIFKLAILRAISIELSKILSQNVYVHEFEYMTNLLLR